MILWKDWASKRLTLSNSKLIEVHSAGFLSLVLVPQTKPSWLKISWNDWLESNNWNEIFTCTLDPCSDRITTNTWLENSWFLYSMNLVCFIKWVCILIKCDVLFIQEYMCILGSCLNITFREKATCEIFVTDVLTLFHLVGRVQSDRSQHTARPNIENYLVSVCWIFGYR